MTIRPSGPDGPGHEHEQIAADHHNLRLLMDQLQDTAELGQIVPQLEHLQAELIEHFELEEGAEGLTKAVGEASPNALNRLDRLFEEHRAFITSIEGIIAQANSYLDGPVVELRARIQGLCARLEAHEINETELLSAAVFTDLGRSE